MQMHDPKHVVTTYLLYSSHFRDEQVMPESIQVLKEQRVGQAIFFIVTYKMRLQEQCYACIQVIQDSPDSWKFSAFSMMGGTMVTNLPQKAFPQIAWTLSASSDGSSFALAVLPNEMEVTSIRFKEEQRLLCEESLENHTLFFFTDQMLLGHLQVELYDQTHMLVVEYII